METRLSDQNHRPAERRLRTSAKAVRREPTPAEARMWRLLRDRRLAAFKFRRQVPMENYIVDFVCVDKKLIIEIDDQHAESTTDAARDQYLHAQGYEITRYWNNDLLQRSTSVLEDIFARLTR